MTPNQWNRNARDSVVSLLLQAGYSEDSSVINQLECMNFDVPAEPSKPDEVPCSTHPYAPHGFNRNASHSADRYVCDCEGWQPPDVVEVPRDLLCRWECELDQIPSAFHISDEMSALLGGAG